MQCAERLRTATDSVLALLQSFHDDVCADGLFSHLEPEELQSIDYIAHAYLT